MDFTVTRRMLDPAAEFEGGSPLPRVDEVAYLRIEAKRKPAFYGYDAMLEAAYREVAPSIDRLDARGFRAFVFLIGADFTPEQIARWPRYDLWANADRLGLKHREAVIEDLHRDGRRRRIGLYRIEMDDLLLACRFQSRANRCVIALSADPEFLSRAVLSSLFETAQEAMIGILLWGDFARSLCGAGHVMLKEHGEFDDLYRDLTLCLPRPVWDAIA